MGNVQEIQDAWLESFKLMCEKYAKSSNAAIVVKAEIIEVLDAGTRQYSVACDGNIYTDVNATSDASYLPGTVVWLLVPMADFDQKKTILNAVDPSSNQYVDEDAIDREVINPENLFKEQGQINLQSWNDSEKDCSYLVDERFNELFLNYLKTYRRFVFSAEIQTEIDINHQLDKGNYGLALTLYFKNKNSEAEEDIEPFIYIMDTHTIEGNPYAFSSYQIVELPHDVGDTWEYYFDNNKYKPTLTAFVNGFNYSDAEKEEKGIDETDIHIKNIQFRMSKYLTEEDITGYYLTLSSSNGNYFKNESEYNINKIITPSLKVNGRDTKIDGWDCYWFVEDSSVDTTHQDYVKLGGIGWKCLNKKENEQQNEDGRISYQYVLNNYQCIIEPDDVKYSLKYKCVLVKDEVITNSATIEITRLNTDYEAILESATGSNIFVEGIGKVRLRAILTVKNGGGSSFNTYWQRFDKNRNYLDDDFYTLEKDNEPIYGDGYIQYITEISFDCALVDKSNLINCTFCYNEIKDDEVKQINLTTKSLNITTSPELTYTLSIKGGDILYKYDADGDSPLVADYDGPISSQLKEIQPISYAVYKPDGTELSIEEYLQVKYKWSFPINSMMKLSSKMIVTSKDDNYYYIEGSGTNIQPLYYDIYDVYNKTKNNNTILLTIDFDGNILNNSVTPQFLKDGESGTNGSKYAALIKYNDHYYGEYDRQGGNYKFHAVYVANSNQSYNSGWYIYNAQTKELINFNDENANKTLKVIAFKDGEILNSDNYTIEWSTFDTTITEPCIECNPSGILILRQVQSQSNPEEYEDIKWEEDKTYCSIIQCCITITNDGHEEKVYCYYPIEITRVYEITEGMQIPTLEGGFEHVLYASDGTNPQYDNTNAFVCNDGVHNDVYSKYVWGDDETYNLKYDKYYEEERDENGNIIYDEDGNPVKKEIPYKQNVRAITQFLNGYTKNYVKVSLKRSKNDTTKIIEDKNNIKKEQAFYNNMKDYYEDVIEHLLDFSDFLLYNNNEETQYSFIERYLYKLNETKNLLSDRLSLLNLLVLLQECVDDNYNYAVKNITNVEDYDFLNKGQRKTISDKLLKYYKHEYLLANKVKLEDLENDSLNIDFTPEEDIKKKYSPLIYDTIKGYADSWKNLQSNYNNTLRQKMLVKDEELNYLHQDDWNSLYELINGKSGSENSEYEIDSSHAIANLPTNHYLRLLAETPLPKLDEETEDVYLQEFVNCKRELELYISQLKQGTEIDNDNENPDHNIDEVPLEVGNGKINSYDTFNNLILQIEKILKPYYILNEEEINLKREYYKNLADEYEERAEALNPQIEKYNFLLSFNESTPLVHVRPIVMTMNRYEMANINAWDGNKIYVDRANGQYLLAPQVGAGIKQDGRFTGMIMGIRSLDKKTTKSQQHIGLFGYTEGYQSLFLNAKDGSATFGVSGEGQILIEPGTCAIIKSSNYSIASEENAEYYETYVSSNLNPSELGLYEEDQDGYKLTTDDEVDPDKVGKKYYKKRTKSGMMIDLTTPEIKFGSGNFRVTPEGHITAAGGGSIGGWEIDDTTIYSNVLPINGRITLDSGANLIGYDENGNKKYEYTSGKIYSHNHDTLDNYKEGFYLSKDGLSIGDTIKITPEAGGVVEVGRLRNNSTKHWTIAGEPQIDPETQEEIGIQYSYISYNTNAKLFTTDNLTNIITFDTEIDEETGESHTKAKGDQVYIGTDGIRLGNKFAIDEYGNVLSNFLVAKEGGYIGGWEISPTALTGVTDGGRKITLEANGNIAATYTYKNSSGQIKTDTTWTINRAGDATFNNISCKNTFYFGDSSSGNYNYWSRTGKTNNTFKFNNGTLGGNDVDPNDGFAFENGSMGLGATPTYRGADGISFANGSLSLTGTIYTESGSIDVAVLDGEISTDNLDMDGIWNGISDDVGTAISSALTGYAKKSDLDGYATKTDLGNAVLDIHNWVTQNFQPKSGPTPPIV